VSHALAIAWSAHADELQAAAAIVVSAGVLWRGVIRPVMRFGHQVQDTLKELKPNGGSSMRDAIDRLERRMTALEEFITTPKEH
jgi:hypothetical protein